MKSRKKVILTSIIIVIVLVVVLMIFFLNLVRQPSSQVAVTSYNPTIYPNNFVDHINNKYLTYTPGTRLVYAGETEEGAERIEVYVTSEKRKVMGVDTIVVWDRVWLNDELIEDTKDWFAQDKEGNVWYFGEDSKELVGGKIVNNEGSWEAGVDGAQPGIVMKANPQIGDSYKQEYYPGQAEDMGEVVGFAAVTIPYGTFENCLQTRDWTPLEPGADEYKYYCPEVGNVVLEVALEDQEKAYLTEVMVNTPPTPSEIVMPAELKTEITEQEAIEIAQAAVAGEVTDVSIEKKFGVACYVVEIDADGTETDVIIEIETGNVLGIET